MEVILSNSRICRLCWLGDCFGRVLGFVLSAEGSTPKPCRLTWLCSACCECSGRLINTLWMPVMLISSG